MNTNQRVTWGSFCDGWRSCHPPLPFATLRYLTPPSPLKWLEFFSQFNVIVTTNTQFTLQWWKKLKPGVHPSPRAFMDDFIWAGVTPNKSQCNACDFQPERRQSDSTAMDCRVNPSLKLFHVNVSHVEIETTSFQQARVDQDQLTAALYSKNVTIGSWVVFRPCRPSNVTNADMCYASASPC